jgi:hypothetical protein
MFADPAATMARVFAFLDLAPAAHIDYTPQNVGGYDGRDAEAGRLLRSFYAPHNETLSRLCGATFDWYEPAPRDLHAGDDPDGRQAVANL